MTAPPQKPHLIGLVSPGPGPLCEASLIISDGKRTLQGEVRGENGDEVSKVVQAIATSAGALTLTITGGSVGVLHVGEIRDVENLAGHTVSLAANGQTDVAEALAHLTKAVAEGLDLTAEVRAEVLAQLEEVGRQASLPETQRSKLPIIKPVLTGIATTLSAGGGLAEVWTTWGPAIRAFFSL